MADRKVRRGIELYIDGKEVTTDIRAIEAEARKLTKEIKKMTIGSDEYVAAQKRIKECNAILMDHRAGLKAVAAEQRSLIEIAGDLANRYLVLWASVSAAITSVLLVYNKFREKLNEREDTKADVKALTGLDDESINWLEQKAVELSTAVTEEGVRIRQSATEILDAFKLVGSAKPDLLQNKEALAEVTKQALILAQASGMDLKHAVDAVTLSMNQYGAAANEAARYANVMAAGSKYGSAAVDAVTIAVTKSGVAASSANIPIEQLVGSIEALAEKGIKNEVAGTGLKSFFLRLEKGAADTRPSVVGLQQALENLANKGLTSADMIKQFGLVGYTVAQAMISSADKVKYYTDVVSGTGVATEQAAIKSETAAAKMEQAKNRMAEAGMELAQQLQPVFVHFMGWTSKIIRKLPILFNWIIKNADVIKGLTIAYGAYLIIVNAAIIKTKLLAVVTLASNVAHKAFATILATVKTAVILYNMAIAYAKDNVIGLARCQIMLNRAMQQNVIGVAVAAFIALGSVIVNVIKKYKEHAQALKVVDNIRKEAVKNAQSEIDKIQTLRDVAKDETRSLEDREKAINKLNAIIPNYNAHLDATSKKYIENKKNLDNYIDSLIHQYEVEGAKGQLSKIGEEIAKLKIEKADAEKAVKRAKGVSNATVNSGMPTIVGGTNAMNYVATANQLKEERNLENINDQLRQQLELKNKITKVYGKDLQNEAIKDEEVEVPSEEGGEGEGYNTGTGNSETARQKKIKEALLAIDAEYDEKAAALKKQYINGDIATETDYTDRLQALELARMDAKLKVAGLEPEQRAKLMDKMMDMEIAVRKKIDNITSTSNKASEEKKLEDLELSYQEQQKFLEDAYKLGIIPTEEKYQQYLLALEEKYNDDKQALLEKQADKRIQEIEDEEANEIEKLRLQKAQRLMTEEEYEKELIKLKEKYAKKKEEVENKSKETSAKIAKKTTEVTVEEADNQSKQLDKYADEIKEVAESVEDMFGDLGENLADALWGDDKKKAWKEMGKEFLKDMLSIVEKYILIKQAQIMADAIATATTFAGVAKAVAKASVKMAAIKASFGLAKGAISNWWTGGFTPGGSWDQPQGIVHSNEFVANRFATANPQVLPVLNLIDAAQRSGSIANLRGEQIAAVASGSVKANPSASQSYMGGTNSMINTAAFNSAVVAFNKAVEKASTNFQKPLAAYCYTHGKGGINEAMTMEERIKNNAKR